MSLSMDHDCLSPSSRIRRYQLHVGPDQLCLDHLEEKNDHLHARLQELLESNRQTRLEFSSSLETPAVPSPRLWEPPARPQPCLAGSGSGLNTHHLA